MKLGGIWQVSGTRLVAWGLSAVDNFITLPTKVVSVIYMS